jgi:hypothetical protein
VSAVWSGQWVASRLEVSLTTASSPVGVTLTDLVGLAVRRNPRRAHLLVSRVLGKHVPTDPRLVEGAGLLLGELVARELSPATWSLDVAAARLRAALTASDDAVEQARALRDGLRRPSPDHDVVVLGYAETATALGDCVAARLGARTYLHSTRRAVAGVTPYGAFEEEHSHATSHLLLPADPAALETGTAVVLVDDELSTGTTALNTIRALHLRSPRRRYVVAALVDLRSPDDRERFASVAEGLGARIDVVALAVGTVTTPADVLERGRRLVESLEPIPQAPLAAVATTTAPVRRVELPWPRAVPETARHGVTPAHRRLLEEHLPHLADVLAGAVQDALAGSSAVGQWSVLVLGTEELMAAPLQLAGALQDELDQRGRRCRVRFSTTTRSPVLPVDEDGYAIRGGLAFAAHDDPDDDGSAHRFAYNVGADPATGRPFDAIVAVVDERGDTPALAAPGGLLDQLGGSAGCVLLVVLPCAPPAVSREVTEAGEDAAASTDGTMRRAVAAQPLPRPLRGPQFGSYAADEVTWLLKDLSGVALEAPVEEREEAIQAGGAHYAESLPVEYQPSEAYRRLFDQALETSADRVATAVGVVTEIVLHERGDDVVLASLARAGAPVGILMRRWAQLRHGISPAHYAVSIVRGRGIDTTALRYLASRHDPDRVVFVDGWTGKGAIARELAAALAQHERATGVRFRPDLAVLADPGHCVRTFGTRDDFLVPSACLSSTVSGLVSRTVLNDELIGPHDFHGAKFYAHLAPDDVSAAFLDAVTARFEAVADEVARTWPDVAASDRTVTWAGWRAVDRISDTYGIGDVNLVKPGVGETTRVLLRRVPWRVLVRDGSDGTRQDLHDDPDLRHVLLLAEQRGVPVEVTGDLPYRCVGLIHPRYTRGATGSDGRATGAHGRTTVTAGAGRHAQVPAQVRPDGAPS